ncbi:MAG: TldD/PmbA family protein [Spirochaetota bacterium]|nr:TldD/PmbA family protein [Spirochaetota bacterium]
MKIFNYAVDRAKNVELITTKAESQSVIFESDLFKKVESSQSQGIGLRCIQNGNIGFSFSNDFEDEGIVNRAIESSQFGEKAQFQFASQQDTPNIHLYSEKTADAKIEDMISFGEEVIDKIKSYNPKIKVDIGVEKEVYSIALRTSEGFNASYDKSLYSVGASGLIAENDQLLNIHKSRIQISPFDSVEEICDPIIEKFELCKTKSQIKTGNYKVLFTPRAFRSILSCLTPGMNGKTVQKGISPLSNRLGDQIISDQLTLIDDGTLSDGISSAPFDGEGTLTRRNVLIDRGIFQTFIFDLQTAALMKKSATGSGSRGYSSTPSPGFRNLIVEPGEESYDSLLSSVEDGILVDQFIGAGQSNVLAGEFSMNLELAYKIENGQPVGQLKDVMMSGNVFDTLNRVLGVGDTLFREGSGHYPYILLDHLSISAKA